MDPSGGDSEIKRAVVAVLEEAIERIKRDAARYSNPTEREYRDGITDAVCSVRILLEEFLEQTALKRGK